MKANHIHYIDALSSDDSWLLLCKKVTKNAEEERDVASLKDVGMRIVKKCQGLPLAIVTIGGALCGKLSKWEWERVERNSAWSQEELPEGVHQALYLSYQDLPSHLKQCFLHCSLFREDSQLKREDLIPLWVAEGFVVKVEGEEYPSLEEIAQGYFDVLVQRSLLQPSKDIYALSHALSDETSLLHDPEEIYGFSCWKMHDLLRLLCHFLAGGENLVITHINEGLASTADDGCTKLRRLSIVAPQLSITAPESQEVKSLLLSIPIQYHKSVRTLLLEGAYTLDDGAVEDCFNKYHRLRVVNLHGTGICSLPESVGNLLHLRYLNLSGCIQLKLKELPKSIEKLKYLQFFILKSCSLRTLPKGLVKLYNLRTLDLDKVPLEELPSGIEGFKNLHVLKGAVFSSISRDNSNSSCSLEEISQLWKLRKLSIFKLGMTSAEFNPNVNGLNSPLKALSYLEKLYLFCYEHNVVSGIDVGSNSEEICRICDVIDRIYTDEEIDRIENIFGVALHPPSSVRQIEISFFFGRQFPQWLMSSSIGLLLPNLKILSLDNCHSCSRLPPLGKLPKLESLHLSSLDAVRSIGAEFFGYEEALTSAGHECGGSKRTSSSPTFFPCLKKLTLWGLLNLEVWHWVPEVGGTVAMPQLETLAFELCPKLSSLPEELTRQATRLTSLFVHKTNINSFTGFPTLEMLRVVVRERGNLSLPNWLVQSLPHLTSLRKLVLVYPHSW